MAANDSASAHGVTNVDDKLLQGGGQGCENRQHPHTRRKQNTLFPAHIEPKFGQVASEG